jgi:2-hydroxy-4-carboxymuconate semialdehyde hemiacetal dehydrogenase
MDVGDYFFRRKHQALPQQSRSWTDHLLWHHAAHTHRSVQYQAGETISDCYAVQGPIHPQQASPWTAWASWRGPIGPPSLPCAFVQQRRPDPDRSSDYMLRQRHHKAFYDDLSDGKDQSHRVSKVDVSMDGSS